MDIGETTPTSYGLVLFQDGHRIIELELRLEGTTYLNTDSGLGNTENSKNRYTAAKNVECKTSSISRQTNFEIQGLYPTIL